MRPIRRPRLVLNPVFKVLGVLVLLMGFLGSAAAGPAEPLWKVGRAKVVLQEDTGGSVTWHLRVSLRNEGRPGKAPVRILGRWAGSRRPPGIETDFVELGRYSQEVALKQTAILALSLRPLGPVPKGNPPLEVVVLTGKQKTDQKQVPMPRR